MRIRGQTIGGKILRGRPRYEFLPEAAVIQAKAEGLLSAIPEAKPDQEHSFQAELQALAGLSDKYGSIGRFMRTPEGRDILAHLTMLEMYLTEHLPLSRSHDDDMMQKGAINVLRSILRDLESLSTALDKSQEAQSVWQGFKARLRASFTTNEGDE